MKIHILYPLKNKPWGGANQFLTALKKQFLIMNIYSESVSKADAILFNLNPSGELSSLLSKVKKIKKKYPDKLIITRIDGPIFLYRGKNIEIDRLFFDFIHNVADGTIFQSQWSKNNCIKLGLNIGLFESIIFNAPDPEIFNLKEKPVFSTNRKYKLIATSWSSNWKKGFNVYKWLDSNLDFSKFEMTFVGNSPIDFKNIDHISPLESKQLAKKLKQNDIFITGSQKDPCSNSLVEAMHCGLPSITLNDGGHPEIISNGGELFNNADEIPLIINKILENYDKYQKNISLPKIDEVGKLYYEFIQKIYRQFKEGNYEPKRFLAKDFLKFKLIVLGWKLREKVKITATKCGRSKE